MSTRKPRRPSSERAESRRAILAAAVRLYAEKGVENVTFGDIAQATGLSRPLVYFYFPDPDTLFLEALVVGTGELHRRFAAAVRPTDPGLEQIVAIGAAYIRFARENPAGFQLMAHNETKQPEKLEDHPLYPQCQQSFDGIMNLLVAALQKGLRDGTIRPDLGDPGKVAICLWGLTHGLIQLATTKGPSIETKLGADFPDMPEFGLDLLRRSLAAPPKRKN